LGAERADQHFAGALIEGWHAPALDAASPALVPWTADALVNYFLDGWDAHHGVAAGPMTAVVDSMAALSEDDAYAIAEYVLSFQEPAGDKEATALAFAATRQFGGSVTPATGPDGLTDPMQVQGQETFTRVCANCHREGTKSVPLALTSTINGPDPANLVRVITDGIAPPTASFDRSMPAFGTSLTASETEALVAFVRAHFTERGPWTNIADRVAEARAAP
jgi:mono/diheme cytochrome c family protein